MNRAEFAGGGVAGGGSADRKVSEMEKRSISELARLLSSATSEYFELVSPHVDGLPWMGGGGEIRGIQAGIEELLDELKDAAAPREAVTP